MHKVTVATIAVSALILAGCATAPPTAQQSATNQPTPAASATESVAPAPTAEPSVDPLAALTIDTTTADSYTYDDGLKITFKGASIAAPEQIGSDPVDGADPVILSFTYDNGSTEAIPLQAVPLTVVYGEDWYDADEPTLFQGDPTFTDLPKQIAPGSTVDVINTYWIPRGEPILVTVNVSGSADQSRPVPMFTGIVAG